MKHQAKKRFGQNFLINDYIINQIVSAGNFKNDDFVIEIGPGLGALTKPLLKKLDHLNVIEIDQDIIQHLEELKLKNQSKLTIYHQDVLKTDFDLLFDNANQRHIKLIGNLPYNISTALLIHLLPYSRQVTHMIFMLQKEVIDRICAKPNTKAYGRLTVMLQYFFNIKRVVSVPPTAFKPQPKVQSEVILLSPKPEYLALSDIKLFENIISSAFQQRRKTISNSLKPYLSSDDMTKLEINPKLRAENLTLEHFVNITNYVASQ
ncbi:16S rRNA (adenine(1518)-N(6)/adenine(1519)-N(6))-dimethyltransferase RsmA [Thiotrichales bacterium 19S9-12]|nr:16S rRNA (adenine(1518)-N(6)/adenine(1519)-N(6))-dimethyltransferase RsmA [Thiotrichales bacterium 19S9-11]MCF6811292.1 16S rRNA (adenine(1518)-N(6)/adenine(1519)-N(6))-dimethyltransferase RsmA [Thiotrichales bacterium 19S9-12]